jgi:GLPGLI family protein
MKYFILVIISTISSFSQNEKQFNTTKIIYKSSVETDNSKPNKNISDLQNKIASYHDKFEYELIFNSSKSIFRMVNKISIDDESIEYKITKGLASDLYFKDQLNKEKIKQVNSFDEIFNIILPYQEYNWNITTESKIINGYTCYKATCDYEIYDNTRKTTLKFTPTVWFAPSLPYSFGPIGLDGLPGLVLEATFNGRIYYFATNIIFNDKSLLDIEKPKEGKYVTESEFKKIGLENYNKYNGN